MSKYIVSYRDYGKPGEVGTVVFTGADLNAGNIVAQSAAADLVRTTMEAITLGGLEKRQLVAWVNDLKVEATDPFAQREMKWLVRYHDTVTTEPQRLEIPCADLQYLDPNASDRILMSDPDVAAFVAAFEAFQLSDAGNPVEIDQIVFVGRRS